MPELLPTLQARRVADGLVDYLTTTFALADAQPRQQLQEFLEDQANGLFKGPYTRLRLPFRPADEDWTRHLEWRPPFTPYRHQAQAYARLTSLGRTGAGQRPEPTLITTGTGSGKTEAFLHPILDHVLRAKRAGVTGTKAIILYPMNALADDQARRLTATLTGDPDLSTVTAAIYTGNQAGTRGTVSDKGLITDRHAIRDTAPDILLTNYKMLDQLLLREDDQPIWAQSATSLQYLVLDEFHTYDGAQGTDVAMLLRRLGLALKSHWHQDDPALTAEDWARPLGKITPVATSATLGDKSDPTVMLDFAHTVFGEKFGPDAVVTETLLSLHEWAGRAAGEALEPVRLRELRGAPLAELAAGVKALGEDPAAVTGHVLRALHAGSDAIDRAGAEGEPTLLDVVRRHPDVHTLVETAAQATGYPELLRALVGPVEDAETLALYQTALEGLIAALSHVRALHGRDALSVDLHFWVRELTRIDRVASPVPHFLWSDDGTWAGADDPTDARQTFPAVYCRHCGRSGWGVTLAAVGDELSAEDTDIRRDHMRGDGRFRALIHAPGEEDRAVASPSETPEGLRWFSLANRRLLSTRPDEDDPDMQAGNVIPVLTRTDSHADREGDSGTDDCPACLGQDGIRFLGSAIATLLSVSLSVLFGDATLDDREKKSLVFTDSVQDAAHRAGFVQSRSHTMSLRSALGGQLTAAGATLDTLVEDVLRAAGDDPFDRFRLVPPDCERLEPFQRFWEAERFAAIAGRDRAWVKRRLLFDAALEFGLQSTYGRTLEATGAAAVQVEAGTGARLAAIARTVLEEDEVRQLGEAVVGEKSLTAWVRGVLEHMRLSGGIEHEWLNRYISEDGRRFRIWGGRPKNGMPAFPAGRSAPAFPRVGAPLTGKAREQGLDTVRSANSWYARWAAKCLEVLPQHGAKLSERLLAELARQDVLTVADTETGAKVYGIPASAVTVRALGLSELEAGRALLVCDVCQSRTPGTAETVAQLTDACCFTVRCNGRLRPETSGASFYRELYTAAQVRRVVAKEHTSLLEDKARRQIEEGFKSGTPGPKDPNVLVATPTLEMGIDIGDLSTVMLSSLPKAVAQYVQRVGRAGRLTGNAFSLAFVTGRGDQLPRLGNPLSLINGQVRPPATYLDAEEILRRQYIASLVDAVARSGQTAMPTRAQEAMRTADGTFLRAVLTLAAEQSAQRLDAFLGSFDTLDSDVAEGLRAWATADADGDWAPEDSLGALLHRAAHEWQREAEQLQRHVNEVEKALPHLRTVAEGPAADEDDRRDLRLAEGAYRTAKRRLSEVRDAHWVSALEERGVLPNYTLLDDTVTLDARVTTMNSETGEFETENTPIRRPSARALTELAPGAVFYTHELAIRIDGLDLGKDGDKIRTWSWCAACGYGRDRTDETAKNPGSCPRCQSASFGDVDQRHQVVRLEHVFAEVRRERDRIDDREDQRRRVQFATVAAADLDPQHVSRAWHVGQEFGVTHHRRMDLRWLNLGQRAAGGITDRHIAGQEIGAKPFRVCAGCGKLDATAGANSREEHRPWCRYRQSQDEDTRQVVLSRELRTEGVVVTLPPHVVGGDSYAVPSLAAALLLGLREDIGGAPDHLQVTSVTVPLQGGGTAPDEALLLHDVVPGGTGYLADLASPERIWRILVKAYRVVEVCACQDEDRRACHRCLMPYAVGARADRLSRVAAARHLRTLLTMQEGETGADLDPERMRWDPEEGAVVIQDGESRLERRFRQVFRERVTAAGGTVKEVPDEGGNHYVVTGLGVGRTWRLVPQLNLAGSRPDFVLLTDDPAVQDVAIFTDGHRFHASAGKNRIADDAAKRQALRDHGYSVLSIVWEDLEDGAARQRPEWLADESVRSLFEESPGHLATTQGVVDDVRNGPVDILLGRLQRPQDADARRNLAERLGILFMGHSEFAYVNAVRDLGEVSAGLLAGTDVHGIGQAFVWRRGPLQVLTRLNADETFSTVVMLDDGSDAVDSPDHHEAWRQWLWISNLLTADAAGVRVMARSQADAGITVAAPQTPVADDGSRPEEKATELTGAWAAVADDLITDDERAAAATLASQGIPVAEVGEEIGGVVATFSWPAQHVAVLVDADAGDADDLRAAGWTVVDADPTAVRAALDSEENTA
ncbi:DEAD/DEAH box helicase [Micrococcus lylae]|uniref:DEAD/DEAH box helicase n=1 Tax=Micrococcus lylae TaxID=1273 RepID=UPI000C7FB39D|nr:DEAD/DEAH box helicase [Micrococcus lylae]WIK82253.1 DEAD/DEAH box helicase [Micrococcus lylae]